MGILNGVQVVNSIENLFISSVFEAASGSGEEKWWRKEAHEHKQLFLTPNVDGLGSRKACFVQRHQQGKGSVRVSEDNKLSQRHMRLMYHSCTKVTQKTFANLVLRSSKRAFLDLHHFRSQITSYLQRRERAQIAGHHTQSQNTFSTIISK